MKYPGKRIIAGRFDFYVVGGGEGIRVGKEDNIAQIGEDRRSTFDVPRDAVQRDFRALRECYLPTGEWKLAVYRARIVGIVEQSACDLSAPRRRLHVRRVQRKKWFETLI